MRSPYMCLFPLMHSPVIGKTSFENLMGMWICCLNTMQSMFWEGWGCFCGWWINRLDEDLYPLSTSGCGFSFAFSHAASWFIKSAFFWLPLNLMRQPTLCNWTWNTTGCRWNHTTQCPTAIFSLPDSCLLLLLLYNIFFLNSVHKQKKSEKSDLSHTHQITDITRWNEFHIKTNK